MGHLHTKTMNRLQAALLEHDFIIQYKKGEIMPADYLSRLPGTKTGEISEITEAFDPFQADLHELQKQDEQLQNMNHFRVHKKWLTQISKQEANYLQTLAPKLFQAHNNQFGGHNAALKTYIRISSSYYWPKIYSDVLNHTKSCLRCQLRKKSTHKPPPLQPLPNPDIHRMHYGESSAAERYQFL